MSNLTSGRGYRIHKQVGLSDGSDELLLVIETNGSSWKLIAKFRGAASDYWSFLAQERAEQALQAKVEEAEKLGWVRSAE